MSFTVGLCRRGYQGPRSLAVSAAVRVDPDVFTDALVLRWRGSAPALPFIHHLQLIWRSRLRIVMLMASGPLFCERGWIRAVAMVSGLPNETVNRIVRVYKNTCHIRVF